MSETVESVYQTHPQSNFTPDVSSRAPTILYNKMYGHTAARCYIANIQNVVAHFKRRMF